MLAERRTRTRSHKNVSGGLQWEWDEIFTLMQVGTLCGKPGFNIYLILLLCQDYSAQYSCLRLDIATETK